MRRDRERLQDMLEAIERIERYAQQGRSAFARDELLQTWVVHHIQIIGEAARKVSDELRARHPDGSVAANRSDAQRPGSRLLRD